MINLLPILPKLNCLQHLGLARAAPKTVAEKASIMIVFIFLAEISSFKFIVDQSKITTQKSQILNFQAFCKFSVRG